MHGQLLTLVYQTFGSHGATHEPSFKHALIYAG